jgi:formylmethanofuran dehydrogenase subunit B
MTSQNNIKNLVCPFCSIHCDDISVSTTNDQYKVNQKNAVCTKKIESYNLNNKSLVMPMINKKIVKLSEALKQISNFIKGHNETLILNHGVELAGLRSILNFASQRNCIIDHVGSKFLYQNIGVVQRTGYMATSLTETKNRADTIIIFGNEIFNKVPRLIDKVLIPKDSLCTKNKKEIILVGNFSEKIVKNMKGKCNVTNIKLDLNLIDNFLKLITANDLKAMKGLKKSELTKIKHILDKSKYLVAIWTASDFIKTLNPEKIISSICKHIVDLNVSSRAACMPISGVLADATSSQVLTWMTGFPSRIKHIDGTFIHDRNAFNSQKLIDGKNVDVVIHVSTINSEKLKINKNITNIVLGHPNTSFTSTPDIFIPVGIPGIDYEGIMFRTDNVVSVALKNIRDIKLPSTQNILDNLA